MITCRTKAADNTPSAYESNSLGRVIPRQFYRTVFLASLISIPRREQDCVSDHARRCLVRPLACPITARKLWLSLSGTALSSKYATS